MSDGRVYTYTWSNAGQLLAERTQGIATRVFTCIAAGRLVTTTLPNGAVTVNTYDAAGGLTQLDHTRDTSLLARYEYELDGVGNRAAATETLTTTTTIRYTYDPLQRLTGAAYSGTYSYTFAYAYDKVGNRTAQTQTITSTLVTTYTYNAANRLTSVNGQAYTWDANPTPLRFGDSLRSWQSEE